MPRKKKPQPNKWPTIPPFSDPENYRWVITKEGGYWRRKRGTLKEAKLNNVLARNANTTKLTNDAARRIVLRLQPFLTGLETGRLTARIAGKLKKSLNKNDRIDFSLFWQFEVQKEYPLKGFMPRGCTTFTSKKDIVVQIPIHKKTLDPDKRGPTEYYFEVIWLYGDPTEDNGLRIDSVTSPLFPMGDPTETNCELVVPIPEKRPYMIFLKASCLQGNDLATDPSFYGMQVISAV